MGDVRQRAGVHEERRALERLQEVRHEGILHEHGHGASHAQVLDGDRIAAPVRADDDAAHALPQILEAGGQGKDRHDLGGDGDGVFAVRGASEAVPDLEVNLRLVPAVGFQLLLQDPCLSSDLYDRLGFCGPGDLEVVRGLEHGHGRISSDPFLFLAPVRHPTRTCTGTAADRRAGAVETVFHMVARAQAAPGRFSGQDPCRRTAARFSPGGRGTADPRGDRRSPGRAQRPGWSSGPPPGGYSL